MRTTDVVIIGAGPVGLTLALDLGRRGIRTLLVERREQVLRLPKMERTNPRSMEIFRRLGIADRIRAAAYPADASMDVLILRSMTKPPLVHQHYPTVAQARAAIAACTDGSLPREPYQLVSQYTLEELLHREVAALDSVERRLGAELESLTQDDAGVTVRLRAAPPQAAEVRTRYVVGCDGANSTVRERLGLRLEGRANLGAITNIFFRCDELLARSQVARGRHYLFAGVDATGGAAGSLVVQDDQRHFGCHMPGELAADADLSAELRRRTGLDIRPQILHAGRWVQNMMVAEAHGRARVFLAGDANHVYIPAGGLGMNTGIVDAANLAWKLAAVIQGWGGPRLLASYGIERQAVARRNIRAVAYAVEGVVAWRKIPVPVELEDAAAERRARAAYASQVEPLNRRVYEMHGTELGYRYESPVICAERGEPPPDEAYRFRPTTWPGAHVPHLWLEPGVSLYDRLGPGFTLLRTGGAAPQAEVLAAALRRIGAPVTVAEVGGEAARGVLQRDLVLVRPDLHVASRGDALPADPAGVAAAVTGQAR